MLGYKTKVGSKPSGDILILERSDIGNAKTAKGIYRKREIAIGQVHTIKVPKDGKEYYRFPLATGEWAQPAVSAADKQRNAGVRLKRTNSELPEPTDP